MVFEEIYKKYYPELKRFTIQLYSDSEEVDDFIQDVFYSLYKITLDCSEIENPRAWLYKAMLNKIRSKYKTSQNHQQKDQEMIYKTESCFDLNEDLEQKEKKRIVFEIIETLDKRDKELIILYYDGFSYSEIAEIIGIKTSSIGTTLLRVIEKIKNSLKNQYHEMFE
ncbi:MAG: ylaC 3 [Bacteroidetes bacterium]|nr:ylaC 3 [Bacteroidota bacterium]